MLQFKIWTNRSVVMAAAAATPFKRRKKHKLRQISKAEITRLNVIKISLKPFQEKETDSGEEIERSMFTKQEKDMLSSFLTEYILEKRLLVSSCPQVVRL